MGPGRYDLNVYRGDTYSWQFALWADAALTLPIDLTGVDVESEIRNQSGGDYVVTPDIGVTMPNLVTLTLSAANSAICPKRGVWDLQLTYPTGIVKTVLGGEVVVTPDVTESILPPARAAVP